MPPSHFPSHFLDRKASQKLAKLVNLPFAGTVPSPCVFPAFMAAVPKLGSPGAMRSQHLRHRNSHGFCPTLPHSP